MRCAFVFCNTFIVYSHHETYGIIIAYEEQTKIYIFYNAVSEMAAAFIGATDIHEYPADST